MIHQRNAALLLLFIIQTSVVGFGQTTNPPQTLRGVLLEQLRTTHDQKDWFVPVTVAIEGLTADQVKWKDTAGNHSIGQLVNHLLFWNQRELEKFKGKKSAGFSGNNDETFNSFDTKNWTATVQKLNEVLSELEKVVESTDEATLKSSASEIAHIGTHNAYHTGQIVYIRKLQGSWNAAKGVK